MVQKHIKMVQDISSTVSNLIWDIKIKVSNMLFTCFTNILYHPISFTIIFRLIYLVKYCTLKIYNSKFQHVPCSTHACYCRKGKIFLPIMSLGRKIKIKE